MDVKDLVFVGFNSRVAALDRDSGAIVWDWKSDKGSGYVSLLLADPQRLIVSVNGYTYCLDPRTGEQQWFNELKGFGSGVTSIAVVGGHTPHHPTQGAAADAAAAAAASAAT